MDKIKRLWRLFWSPTARFSVGGLLLTGMVLGVLFWGGFNWAMALSNTEQFCISCHEMRDNVFEESKQFVHYSNRSGVRAICSDCHVPKNWFGKVWRKIKATNELYHKIMGTIDTPEKFEAHRLELAERVWARMEANDSQACRNCHQEEYMAQDAQQRRAWTQHQDSLETGDTCIDCHKGIAHKSVHEELGEEAAEDLDFTF